MKRGKLSRKEGNFPEELRTAIASPGIAAELHVELPGPPPGAQPRRRAPQPWGLCRGPSEPTRCFGLSLAFLSAGPNYCSNFIFTILKLIVRWLSLCGTS